MKKIVEVLKKFFGNKTVIFLLSFTILNALLIYYISKRLGNGRLFSGTVTLIATVIEVVISALLLRLKKAKKNLPLEKKFLLLAIPLGLVFMFVLPAEKAPDSYVHMIRTFDVCAIASVFIINFSTTEIA